MLGCLLGIAVGDAMGLACEGLSRTRQRRLFGEIRHYRFLGRWGMISDDTEHACMTAQSLISSNGEPDRFIHDLSWRLRLWLLSLPAGIGFATLHSTLRLWLGFSGKHSGVFSAGNGPAMRSPIIGVSYGSNPQTMLALVRASTFITHTDPKAEYGAIAVALAAWMSSQGKVEPGQYYQHLNELLPDTQAEEFLHLIQQTIQSVETNENIEEFF